MRHATLTKVALVAVLSGAAIFVFTPSQSATAQPDVSGDWDLTLFVTIPGFESETYCATVITQDGGSFDITMFCPELGEFLGAGDFTGTIDDAGELSASGTLHRMAIGLSGTLSSDGQSFAGRWTFGTLQGSRSTGFPVDVDGDGCTTEDERDTALGSQSSGGLRDPLNPWDYFNPSQDGVNRVDDITAVVQKYGHDDRVFQDYEVRYDRTELAGGNPWQFGPPDETIRTFDITAAVRSYGHDCGP